MDAVIHHHKEDARWGGCYVRVPAVQQDGDVVVPVQKDKWLFVNDNEKGVNEFAVE